MKIYELQPLTGVVTGRLAMEIMPAFFLYPYVLSVFDLPKKNLATSNGAFRAKGMYTYLSSTAYSIL